MDERPYVILNVAMTADGKTDTHARRGAAISSASDLERVDRLRAESDAVMVGGRTLLGDDPRLTVKSAALRAERLARGREANPIKVGVLSNLNDPRTGIGLRLDGRFLTHGPARVMLFTTPQSAPARIAQLRERGARVFLLGKRRVDLGAALRTLRDAGVERLLVEGGGTLNMELLRRRWVDEIYVYVAPLIFGGADAPTWADGPGLARDEAILLQLIAVEPVAEGGLLIHYRLSGA